MVEQAYLRIAFPHSLEYAGVEAVLLCVFIAQVLKFQARELSVHFSGYEEITGEGVSQWSGEHVIAVGHHSYVYPSLMISQLGYVDYLGGIVLIAVGRCLEIDAITAIVVVGQRGIAVWVYALQYGIECCAIGYDDIGAAIGIHISLPVVRLVPIGVDRSLAPSCPDGMHDIGSAVQETAVVSIDHDIESGAWFFGEYFHGESGVIWVFYRYRLVEALLWCLDHDLVTF